ncbi:MAG: Asp23/Gls24 family envelope stress response protein [Candidatus Omnitrophica bacterium]|nr:Asp23/Gls24 family envelope stress response protein [Candidatus Omnitrophota bacterium]
MDFTEGKHGEIKIRNEVITAIVRKATIQVEGVDRIASGFSKGILSLFGRRKFFRGVTVEETKDKELKISVSVVIMFGVHIPTVVNKIQLSVRDMLEQMAGIMPAQINVEVSRVTQDSMLQNVVDKIRFNKKESRGG